MPIGEYSVRVESQGFAQAMQSVVVVSGTEPVLHVQLKVSGRSDNITVTVSASPEAVPTDTATPIILISRQDMQRTPGADRTNSLAMITDYVPGAYITHDQLHIRGGHQVSWLIDGVPVPNTNIARIWGRSSIRRTSTTWKSSAAATAPSSATAPTASSTLCRAPASSATTRPSWSPASAISTRPTTRSTSAATPSALPTTRSVNGNRSNLGLQTPAPQLVHDAENGYGGFGSLIFNARPSNQLRLVTSLRKDYYQIPYDPDPNRALPNSQYQSFGLRDGAA